MLKGCVGKKCLGVTFIALAGVASEAEAFFCAPLPVSDINSIRDYAFTFVDILSVLKSAVGRANEFAKANDAADGIAVFETARQEYECVITHSEAFAKSTNETISGSAMGISGAAMALESNSEAERQHLFALLDGGREKPSETAERVGKLEVRRNDAWDTENQAVVLVCMGLIEFGPDKKQRVALNAHDRRELVAKIRKAFGNPSSKATCSEA